MLMKTKINNKKIYTYTEIFYHSLELQIKLINVSDKYKTIVINYDNNKVIEILFIVNEKEFYLFRGTGELTLSTNNGDYIGYINIKLKLYETEDKKKFNELIEYTMV